ncbi:hypothetical protein Dvina_34215 [Dactylosporangium vinaceum]|uniref:Integral membrane protein n=1 Tax=Dactylosporangium vinaceum TaxID=53362 RepID=A0ABV5MM90_9ACTN|nr:hypothetical protein [Dactylosporangium vinaceum]UAB93301.1 hypothetical protein Dvina_34215 [Dactylosporangium vinaceum]
MLRLLRVPVVLVFAAMWALGSYALGFLWLPDDRTAALAAACIGGLAVTAALGSLISRPWPVVLALPLAVGALTTSVYAAGQHHLGLQAHAALAAGRVLVPLLAAYTLLLGIAGTMADAATVRRFRRHMAG